MSAPTITARIVAATVAAVATIAVPVTLAVPADARGGAEVIRTGDCSLRADWKLKVKQDNGRLEVEAEVDSNRVGQTWRWFIRHNGSISARGVATTQAPSGSFTVRRRLVDLAGIDTIVFRARNPRTDEVCRGVVRL